MRAVLDHVEDTATNIKTFWFKPERNPRQIAGQFTELYLPHDHDDRGDKRWFTLSNSPTDPLLSITTKFAGDTSSTFKKLLFSLEPGTQVSLADPMGDFVLPKDASIPLVFVAGGIGVTPIHSMIKYLADKDERRDITLFYAANHEDDLAFTDLFTTYDGLTFVPIIREPSSNWHGETGTLESARVLKALEDSPESLVYLSGPEPMIKPITEELKQNGVNKRRIVTDFFPGYAKI